MKFLIGLILIVFLISSSVPNFTEALMESDQERADRELAEALMESDQERADRELAEAQTYESTCKDVSKEAVIDGLQKKYVINQEKYESCINNYENQSSSSSDTKWFQGIVILAVIGVVAIIVVKLTKERRYNSQNSNTSDYSYASFLRRCSWEQAEDLVGKLFEKKGYNVTVGVLTRAGTINRSRDFGIDVSAQNDENYLGIQVKHWKSNVGFDAVAKTLGVAQEYNKVIIISTTSGFTSQALQHASNNSSQIELWDSARFIQELKDHSLNI
jgi:hypothetical protein